MATTIENLGYEKFVSKTLLPSVRGAQMGRDSLTTDPPTDKKIYTKYVPLTDGYDRGGAYWGCNINGQRLYVEFTADLTWWRFVRK
jgi:hypothetical protein